MVIQKTLNDLYQERLKIRQERNRYYTIAYFGNYSAQVRQNALVKIQEYEEKLQQKIKEIEEERKRQWKNY